METVTSLRSERPARNEEKKMMLISSALLIILYGLTATWAQVISFPRCNNSTVRMEFVYANPSAIPYDLFSPTRRSTCGKRAGTLTGSGSYADPYVISVDLSKGLNNQSPDCGITQTGVMTYTLTMIEMQSCEGLKTTDRNYTVSCTLYVPIVNTPITTSTMLPLMTMNYNANYTCQPPKAIIFHYKQTSLPPYDIYAKGKETTCSKSAGLGSGTGITGDPYILRMDGNAAVPDCGMTELGYETYSVLVHVQQVANVITGADITYLLTCNFTLLSNNIITSATLPVKEKPIKGTAYLWQASAILYVTSEKDYSALSTFDVGDPIRLVAQLGDGRKLTYNCLYMSSTLSSLRPTANHHPFPEECLEESYLSNHTISPFSFRKCLEESYLSNHTISPFSFRKCLEESCLSNHTISPFSFFLLCLSRLYQSILRMNR